MLQPLKMKKTTTTRLALLKGIELDHGRQNLNFWYSAESYGWLLSSKLSAHMSQPFTPGF